MWLGEAVVTLQIKLLGGNMYATVLIAPHRDTDINQFLHAVGLNHRLYAVSVGHSGTSQRVRLADHCPYTSIRLARPMGYGGRRQHSWWIRCREEQGRAGSVPSVRVLRGPGMPVFHRLDRKQNDTIAVFEFAIVIVQGCGMCPPP